ncbi:MAG: hypothetical protein R3A11_01395 [Bdellovibrionota bacterium]
MSSPANIQDFVRQKITGFDRAMLEPFVSTLEKHLESKQGVLAVIAYGSCLSQNTKSSTSTPDFYVIVDSYKHFYSSSKDCWINRILPPSIFHFECDQTTAKYNVISLDQLKNQTQPGAKDVYHIGRFSKRMALITSKKSFMENEMAIVSYNATMSAIKIALTLLPSHFTLAEAASKMLEVSYLGDVRVEASNKVQRIFEAESEYYLSVVQRLLSLFPNVESSGDQRYQQKSSTLWLGKTCSEMLLFRSRIRSQLRWPKNMFTVDNWIDYLLAKFERSHGIKFELSEKERKYWYIFGWKYFFRLKKKKVL